MIKTVFLSGREYCLKANWSSCLNGILKTYPIFNSIYFYITLKKLMHKVAGDIKAVKVVLLCYVSEILMLRISIFVFVRTITLYGQKLIVHHFKYM